MLRGVDPQRRLRDKVTYETIEDMVFLVRFSDPRADESTIPIRLTDGRDGGLKGVAWLLFMKEVQSLLLTTHSSLLTTYYSLLITHYLLLTTYYLLLTTHYSALTTYYLLFTFTYYLLLTTDY